MEQLEFEACVLNDDLPSRASKRRELVGVPPVEFTESPSSWIVRIAISQGVAYSEILQHYKLPTGRDFDLDFTLSTRRMLALACGLQPESFKFMSRMFNRVRSIDPRGERYLLSQNGYPRYRYCPKCLFEQKTKYFPLEWRFKAWRFCPAHNELLQDRCPHCSAFVVLPNDHFMGGRWRGGVDFITDCFVCGMSLYKDRPPLRFDVSRRQLSPSEMILVRNGRAVLAAFKDGQVKVSGHPGAGSLRYLNIFERSGFLPHEWSCCETHEASHVKYRHPISHDIVHLNKEPNLRRKPWMAGLFDG